MGFILSRLLALTNAVIFAVNGGGFLQNSLLPWAAPIVARFVRDSLPRPTDIGSQLRDAVHKDRRLLDHERSAEQEAHRAYVAQMTAEAYLMPAAVVLMPFALYEAADIRPDFRRSLPIAFALLATTFVTRNVLTFHSMPAVTQTIVSYAAWASYATLVALTTLLPALDAALDASKEPAEPAIRATRSKRNVV